MKTSLIVAVSSNGMIGNNNKLPWHIPEDLRWFKKQTIGKPVIMGRYTWESLGRPLPGRKNIVLTRQQNWKQSGAIVSHSFNDALNIAKNESTNGEAMVIGGASVFRQSLSIVERIYLTEINRAYDGDTYFPAFDRTAWREISREPQDGDPPFTFVVLERVTLPPSA